MKNIIYLFKCWCWCWSYIDIHPIDMYISYTKFVHILFSFLFFHSLCAILTKIAKSVFIQCQTYVKFVVWIYKKSQHNTAKYKIKWSVCMCVCCICLQVKNSRKMPGMVYPVYQTHDHDHISYSLFSFFSFLFFEVEFEAKTISKKRKKNSISYTISNLDEHKNCLKQHSIHLSKWFMKCYVHLRKTQFLFWLHVLSIHTMLFFSTGVFYGGSLAPIWSIDWLFVTRHSLRTIRLLLAHTQ